MNEEATKEDVKVILVTTIVILEQAQKRIMMEEKSPTQKTVLATLRRAIDFHCAHVHSLND